MVVLIPAYEPDRCLVRLVTGLRAAAPGAHLVIVDDGSGPAYSHLFEAVRAMGCTVIEHPVNLGKGRALKSGFRYLADNYPGEDVMCADSDGQHTVIDILRVAAHVRTGETLVLGVRRFSGAVPLRSRLGNSVTRGLFRAATRHQIQDAQTGLRGYSYALLPWLQTIYGERFEYELNILLKAARAEIPIAEVDIETIYLQGNISSHFRPVIDSARVYAPLAVFLLSSLSAFLVDVLVLLMLYAMTGALLPSVVGARIISASVNFMANRRIVFAASTSPIRMAAARYVGLATALLAANYGLLATMTGLGLALLPAKLASEALLVTASYEAQRHFVFLTGRIRGHRGDIPAGLNTVAQPKITTIGS